MMFENSPHSSLLDMKPPPEITKLAWNYANDAYLSDLSSQYPAKEIAEACVILATKGEGNEISEIIISVKNLTDCSMESAIAPILAPYK
jgi:hypothetical protein